MKTIGKILLVRRAALCRGMGVLEKTDRIDAGMIAWYEQVKQVRPTEPASPQQAHLQALVVRLRQLTDVQTQQRQQARLVTDQVVLAGYSTLLGLVAAQIRSLEAARCAISCTSSRAWCAPLRCAPVGMTALGAGTVWRVCESVGSMCFCEAWEQSVCSRVCTR